MADAGLCFILQTMVQLSESFVIMAQVGETDDLCVNLDYKIQTQQTKSLYTLQFLFRTIPINHEAYMLCCV